MFIPVAVFIQAGLFLPGRHSSRRECSSWGVVHPGESFILGRHSSRLLEGKRGDEETSSHSKLRVGRGRAAFEVIGVLAVLFRISSSLREFHRHGGSWSAASLIAGLVAHRHHRRRGLCCASVSYLSSSRCPHPPALQWASCHLRGLGFHGFALCGEENEWLVYMLSSSGLLSRLWGIVGVKVLSEKVFRSFFWIWGFGGGIRVLKLSYDRRCGVALRLGQSLFSLLLYSHEDMDVERESEPSLREWLILGCQGEGLINAGLSIWE